MKILDDMGITMGIEIQTSTRTINTRIITGTIINIIDIIIHYELCFK